MSDTGASDTVLTSTALTSTVITGPRPASTAAARRV
jgi:hypothetical protein